MLSTDWPNRTQPWYRLGEVESPGCGATGFPLAPPPNSTLPTEHAQLTCCYYKG